MNPVALPHPESTHLGSTHLGSTTSPNGAPSEYSLQSDIDLADQPTATVIVCTCNRGASAVRTIQTILANRYADFEVLLIDQSKNDNTATAIEPFRIDPRFKYIRTDTIGKGFSLNIGLREAKGEVVLFTDDDCWVPDDWIALMVPLFEDRSIGMAFCNVKPAPHDARSGFIPSYEVTADFIARTIRDKSQVRGMGAGMAVLREAAQEIGGFDESLGPGARFFSADETDLAVRMLLNGWHVYATNRVSVIHDGFRLWRQGKDLAKRDWTAIGAAYAKPIKLGKWAFMPNILSEGFCHSFWNPLTRVFRGQKPQGVRNFVYFWSGFWQGMKVPVDPRQMVFIKE